MSFPRYEQYKDSGEGWLSEVPAHWQLMPNKAFLLNTNDLVGTNSSDFILLSLTLSGVIVRDIESGKGKFPAEFDSYKAVESKDLVFCLFDLDETPRTIGLANHAGMITGAYEVLRCRPLALPSYICYFYLHVDEFKGLRPWYTGLRKVVRRDTFMSIKLALPPMDEQKTIASFLDRETAKIDALIEQRTPSPKG
jgi:type I restriction enzyme S subunit